MIDNTIEEIQEMQTHSSSTVAVKAVHALLELVEREFTTVEEYERTLERNASALRRANPSHASLHNVMRGVVRNVVGHADSVEEAKELTELAVRHLADDVENGKRRAAVNAAELLTGTGTILTHDYSSTVLETLRFVLDEGTDLTAYVTEARPRYLGRKTARTLADIDGIEPHLVVDSASGCVLDECDRVVIGMTCIVDDVLYNRVGTFPIVAAANEVGVPVTVIGSSAKIIEEGFRFENEYRPAAEVLLEPTEGVAIDNPAYDATPVSLLDQVVTDNGVREL